MTSHLLLLICFAARVATVFGVLLRDAPRAQARTAALMFAGLVGGALLLAWILYPLPL